ncbi:Tetratricopeptide TPR_2 repeat protein [Anaeromyxobacter sp. K]|uniref:tetratricopeptide repeat protein n=1 Tax=Anaeromyxobacter sp. (strain K) TaxID=447217 RepID=UPI00015F9242|nr:tetratricopeptide repeat protein [Anaeromyxobacter sp. K]ACG74615.1 Tetratricopeptide TPR_2 repeat protein [Anaeromyxobacter sp. K]
MTRALALGAVVVALAAGPARAADPRPQPKEADLGQKRQVAPDASLGGSLQAAKKVAEPGGPKLDFETFRKKVEVDISAKRREEIASLQQLIQLGGGSATETPQWYFRLAELLWEESQYFFFEANRRDDRIIEIGTSNPGEVGRLQEEKKGLDQQSRRLQEQAVALYKAIISRYPSYPRLDEVLYFLGENLSRRDRNDPDALKAYRALIQKFPSSRYVPDAWMAFGEYYFERANKNDRNGNLRKALESYRKAAEYQESSVYGYALYKQGWVHYNLGNWSEALELFRGVIFFGEMPTSTVPADRKLALVKEARKDYVRTYSHVGSAEGAWDDFRRVGGQTGWWDMLKSLAGLYFDEGKDRDAVLVYHRMIQEKPLSVEAPFFQSRIVTCAGRMGRKDAAVAQAHVFVRMLRDIEASAEGKDPKNAKVLKDARRDAESTLRILAVQYHNEWKKTRDDPVAGYAAAVYKDYLDVFPGEPPAYEMRFFHAELLYALADFEAAGAEYERVALADVQALKAKPQAGQPAPKPGKFFKDALENAVFAYDLVAKKLDETEKRQPSDPKKKLAMAPQRQKLAEACQRYLEYQPRGEKWVEVAYKLANLHYRHNAFGEASDLFTRIALDHPQHELAGYSANLVLDAYNLLGDWRNVNGWAKRFYDNRALIAAHPQLKDDLSRVIEQSAFKVIEEKEKAQDFVGAAEQYLAFARDWPTSRLAPTAYYNASVDYVRAHRLDRAMEIREQFLQRYPTHTLAPKSLYDNAEAYEAVADFGRAADHYERYFQAWRAASRREPPPAAKGKARARGKAAAAVAEAPAGPPAVYEEKKANDAIVNAAVFRAGLREWAKAEAATRAYLDTWPNGPDARRMFRSLADLYGKQGQASRELRQLEEFQLKYARDPEDWMDAQQRIAAIQEKSGNGAAAQRTYQAGYAYWRRNRDKVKERGLGLVAQAMYLELEDDFGKYDKITLDVAPNYLKAQLQVKGRKLKQLEDAYGEVVKLKQAGPAICALYKIGLGYERFARALHAAPIPREIRGNKAFVEEYRAQLTQASEPLERKAVEGFELAANASRDYGVVNACARDASAMLAKAKPDQAGAASAEVVPPVPAPPIAEAPKGYGILAEIQPVQSRPAAGAPRAAEAPLPVLRLQPAGARSAAAEPGDPRPGRTAAEPADARSGRADAEPQLPRRKKGGDEDEDLLP